MKEIVVLSGKGGTGKTSLTAALALVAGQELVVADCDVDAANLHLLLDPAITASADFFSGELATIHSDYCTQCGICVQDCRFDAITFRDSRHQLQELDCEGCGYCARICPMQAITMQTRKTGRVMLSHSRTGCGMVYARMEAGAGNSGKLVARVKQEARQLATATQIERVLIDGAPGLSCPVISSLAGADYVLLVAEPTVSSLHDLRRLYDVIRGFDIPMGAVINKGDLNPQVADELKSFFRDHAIDFLTTIPYDEQISGALSEGKTMAEINPHYYALIGDIWQNLCTTL